MTDDTEEATPTVGASAEPARAVPPEPAPAPVSPAAGDAGEYSTAIRDTIFDRLVGSKRDWLAAFRKIKGRDPDAAELDAFDIGETIDRRIGTYRKLAEVAINGDPFWASSTVTPVSEMTATPPTATPEQAVAPPSEASMSSFTPAPKGKDGWFIKRR